MDPVVGGALKGAQQNVFQEAQQQIEKSNQQVSDFERLREKLEQQDAISNPQQADHVQNIQQPQQLDPSQNVAQVQQVNDVQLQQIPEIKSLDEMQTMVKNIRSGQERLNQIISEATGGNKSYSPSELIAMQAEVGKITQELELASKVVQHFVDGVKQTLNMQL